MIAYLIRRSPPRRAAADGCEGVVKANTLGRQTVEVRRSDCVVAERFGLETGVVGYDEEHGLGLSPANDCQHEQ